MDQQHELHPSQRSLPARSRRDALTDIQVLPEEQRERILAVLVAMRARFWHLPRKLQVVALLRATRGRGVSQKVIAVAMGVANSYVTKYKQRDQERPHDMFPLPGRPSPIGAVFDQIEAFIDEERLRPTAL